MTEILTWPTSIGELSVDLDRWRGTEAALTAQIVTLEARRDAAAEGDAEAAAAFEAAGQCARAAALALAQHGREAPFTHSDAERIRKWNVTNARLEAEQAAALQRLRRVEQDHVEAKIAVNTPANALGPVTGQLAYANSQVAQLEGRIEAVRAAEERAQSSLSRQAALAAFVDGYAALSQEDRAGLLTRTEAKPPVKKAVRE